MNLNIYFNGEPEYLTNGVYLYTKTINGITLRVLKLDAAVIIQYKTDKYKTLGGFTEDDITVTNVIEDFEEYAQTPEIFSHNLVIYRSHLCIYSNGYWYLLDGELIPMNKDTELMAELDNYTDLYPEEKKMLIEAINKIYGKAGS